MALIKCPECGNECSDKAEFCPKCGYPFKTSTEEEEDEPPQPIGYETKVIKMRVWGRSQNAISSKLQETLAPYTAQGWEYVSMVEDPWRGGVASPVYMVTIRKPKYY